MADVQHTATGTGRCRVLVIDDEPAVHRAFRTALLDTEFELMGVFGGVRGLRVLRERPPQITFLDLHMPVMDGIAVLDALRDRQPPGIIYVITSYYGDYADDLAALAKAGLRFEIARKPIAPGVIRELVRAACPRITGGTWVH